MTKKLSQDARQRQITGAAVLEFLQKGYEGASLDNIAKRAGLSKGGVYHHFPGGKKEVLIAAAMSFMEPLYEMMDLAGSMENPLKGLAAFIRAHLEYCAEHPREMSFLLLAQSQIRILPKMQQAAYDYCYEMVSFFDSLFKDAVSQGLCRESNTENRARALFLCLQGAESIVGTNSLFEPRGLSEEITNYFLHEPG
ncbi:TetR/AcrR family transcriptional regulator [Dethiosulfatarculus sandiegensis]|uniref:HTH tetR-type domain-containing protein n=1 Tax=Dethiosulfatarculus sandiegensis TaxID=1429043 RepID=A0A0D2J2H4_9BACT|nr:TetR/AcrR family transcriptional regulator [Dethiosulfatarculus sandiegensis]KIX12404.1 hypothetical protein X474_18910 [Dethiosulfatarculus sandiegensis]